MFTNKASAGIVCELSHQYSPIHFLCLGANHTTAPLELREKLAFNDEITRSTLGRLNSEHGQGTTKITEMVILSTCNRIELYAVSTQPVLDDLEAFLYSIHGIPMEEFRAQTYRYTDEQVIHHLFRVTTGLDSLVLGEHQVLGQVTRSYELALKAGACGAILSRLFQSAIHAGKRVRTETAIGRNPASVSSLAASLAAKEVKNLSSALVVVIGAGEMAELAVEALRKRGATQIAVVNRNLERAQVLANRLQARAYMFQQLEVLLQQADIVISSTSAPHAVINTSRMADIMRERTRHPIVMIDIAVPRDIDPEVNQIRGVKLFDLDSLDCQVQSLLEERAAEVPRVEAIIGEEKALLGEYFKQLNMLPIVSRLRMHTEAIRRNELEKTLSHLPGLSEGERKRIDALTRSLVKKIMQAPTQRLLAEASCPHASEYAMVTRTLFDLPDEQEVCAFSGKKCSISKPASGDQHPYHAQTEQFGD